MVNRCVSFRFSVGDIIGQILPREVKKWSRRAKSRKKVEEVHSDGKADQQNKGQKSYQPSVAVEQHAGSISRACDWR